MEDIKERLIDYTQTAKPKILVVDDRPENHRAIEKILEYSNATIISALSGVDALSLSLRHQFSVILLDVMMPNMDGFETASLMRINEETKTTPIIFITAADRSDEYEFRGYELGAVDYLFKPVKAHTLSCKVKILLEMEQQKYQLQQSLEDIQRLENRNQLILNSVGEGIIGLDIDGQVIFTNPAAEELLGMTESELRSLNILGVMSGGDAMADIMKWTTSRLYDQCSNGKSFHEPICAFTHKVRTAIPVEYTATPIKENDNFIGIVIAFQDITERKKTEEQLLRLAQYDSLTGLINRYAFNQVLNQALSRAIRSKNKLSLLFIDLDQFKQVNDSLSHEVGDSLLQEVAQRLNACIRDGDIISRIGGDEFTIVLESFEKSKTPNAAIVSQKILETLSKPFYINDHEISIGASIGIAEYPSSADDVEGLMRCSDLAMYKAKEKGRNNYQFFTEEMQFAAEAALSLERQLRVAVDQQDFQLYYQPKIDLKTGKMAGSEALLRWKDENGQFISPEIFVVTLEELGLICQVGEWIIEQVCLEACKIRDYLSKDTSFTIAINLSMKQLSDPNLANILTTALKKYNLNGQHIEVEITESMMMGDPEITIAQLNAIHKLGVSIAIDDFGTGYSSLGYLQDFPIDTLKVDKSFTQKIETSNSSEKIVKTIVTLAKTLNLNVVAEGVETLEQLEFLRGLQCDTIQGFYYSKPLPTEDLIKLIDKTW